MNVDTKESKTSSKERGERERENMGELRTWESWLAFKGIYAGVLLSV